MTTESTYTDEPEMAMVGHAKTSKMSDHDESDGAAAWMTVEAAAAVLRITPRQVNRYGHGDDARLRTQRVSRRVLYHRQDVLARLEAAEAERAALQAKLHDAERTIALLTGLQEAEAAPVQPGLLGRWWKRLRR